MAGDRPHPLRARRRRARRVTAAPAPPGDIQSAERRQRTTDAIARFLEDLDGWRRRGERITLVARSEAQGRRLQEILRDHDLGARLGRELPEPGGIALWIGELSGGFRIEPLRLRLITEQEIFGAHALPRRRARPKEALPFTSFADLKAGDYVVHVDHGIARYLGLQQLPSAARRGTSCTSATPAPPRSTCPSPSSTWSSATWRGSRPRDAPALDRLGGTSWAKAKERVRASVREMAGELLRLYATRADRDRASPLPPTPPGRRSSRRRSPTTKHLADFPKLLSLLLLYMLLAFLLPLFK